MTLVSPWDLEDAYAAALKGNVKGAAVHVPTVIDETLAPPGEHLVIIQSFAPTEAVNFSSTARETCAERLLELGELVLPELSEHVIYVVGGSEAGEQVYPLHRIGPIYGWANSVAQTGPRRLPYKTPISGLYLAGHWTQPGSGVWTVVLSGINAARYTLGQKMSEAIWPLGF